MQRDNLKPDILPWAAVKEKSDKEDRGKERPVASPAILYFAQPNLPIMDRRQPYLNSERAYQHRWIGGQSF